MGPTWTCRLGCTCCCFTLFSVIERICSFSSTTFAFFKKKKNIWIQEECALIHNTVKTSVQPLAVLAPWISLSLNVFLKNSMVWNDAWSLPPTHGPLTTAILHICSYHKEQTLRQKQNIEAQSMGLSPHHIHSLLSSFSMFLYWFVFSLFLMLLVCTKQRTSRKIKAQSLRTNRRGNTSTVSGFNMSMDHRSYVRAAPFEWQSMGTAGFVSLKWCHQLTCSRTFYGCNA